MKALSRDPRALRRFHRYLACKTCGALAGLACYRMPVPRPFPGRVRHTNDNPHKGRGRTKERCGDADGGRHPSGCNLPPKHGGDWHYGRQGQRWGAM